MKNAIAEILKRIMTVLLAAAAILLLLPAQSIAAGSVTIDTPIENKLEGDAPATEDKFTFKLTGQDAATPMPLGSTAVDGLPTVYATIYGGGKLSFGTITYTQVGEYHYTVSQVADANAKYTARGDVYAVTVLVTWKSEVGGEMQTAVYVYNKNAGAEQAKNSLPRFINTYGDASAVKLNPPVSKTVTGSPATAGTFIFYLRAQKLTNPMPEGSKNGIKTVSVKGAGAVEFGEISYTEAGTYAYSIYEQLGSAAGYTYDKTVYTMKVTVTETAGKLTEKHTFSSSKNASSSSAVFTNIYSTATPTPFPTSTPSTSTGNTGNVGNPKTGEIFTDYILWILLALSAIGITVLVYRRRRGRRH